MPVGPGLLAQVFEHRGRGGVAHRPGVARGQERLDGDSGQGRRGKDDQPAGWWQAMGGGAQRLGQWLHALGA